MSLAVSRCRASLEPGFEQRQSVLVAACEFAQAGQIREGQAGRLIGGKATNTRRRSFGDALATCEDGVF
jgi:hypothetical protein